MVRHGSHFANSPFNQLRPILENLDASQTAVVYDEGSENTTFVFLPVVMNFGRHPRQFVAWTLPGGQGQRLEPVFEGPAYQNPNEIYAQNIVVIRTKNQPSRSLIQQLRTGDEPLGDGPVAQTLKDSADFSLTGEHLYVSNTVAIDVDIFSRRNQRPAGH